MAAKGTTFDNDLLKLIFNGTNIALLADNTVTTPLTNLYVSLHTASPGVGGDQTTNEAAYTGYGRVAVARTAGGWTVTTNSVSPVATIVFPASTSGPETETYFAVGTVTTGGTGKLLYFGTITPNIIVNSGTTPQILSSSTIVEN
jgi:hypothetical protein